MPTEGPTARIRVEVDLGQDRGQNFGSLFEVTDARGQAVLGAGFLGAYNTYYRNARHVLHCFLRPAQGESSQRLERLARPTDNCGHYLFEADGRLWADPRGADPRPRCWDAARQAWQLPDGAAPLTMQVGAHRVVFSTNRVLCDDRPIFDLDPRQGRSGVYYYAHGFLFVWVADPDPDRRRRWLYACPWDPDRETKVGLSDGRALALSTPGEFPYSYGQWGAEVLVGTNTGGIYRFDGEGWHTLLEPDMKTSFQLYSMVNYYDRLLMGHYPSGELYAYDGERIDRLAGWPPRPPGVMAQAREAQTITIYRGDLFVGLWPWGELWRYDRHADRWGLVERLFSQPALTDRVDAPWAEEMRTRHPEDVYNLWGQRVTSLIPFGDALYTSTSNKGATPYEPRFQFLAHTPWQEYGAVYRLFMNAHLSVPVRWNDGPTRLELVLTPDRMSAWQDGRELGAILLSDEATPALGPQAIAWGRGVYGPLAGEIQQAEAEGALFTP